jgi:lipopolysaccharide assembly outer membrane protein LptD (OstA)
MNDSFLGLFYKLSPSDELTLRVGGGIIIPTYDTELDNNNMDIMASASFSYALQRANLFGGYSYTVVNDDDVLGIASYQNTHSYSGGVGFYLFDNLYLSGYYTNSESIYKDTDNIETLSLYTFYTINKNWFTTFSYAYGLSDTAGDNSVGVRLGYYF